MRRRRETAGGLTLKPKLRSILNHSLTFRLFSSLHTHIYIYYSYYIQLRCSGATFQIIKKKNEKKIWREETLVLFSIIFFFFRYQFFLQVKQDILQGRLPVSFDLAAELGAYVVQCEQFFFFFKFFFLILIFIIKY